MSRRERTVARRAAARAGRNNSGCLLGVLLLPVGLLLARRKPHRVDVTQTWHDTPAYRRGYKDAYNHPPDSSSAGIGGRGPANTGGGGGGGQGGGGGGKGGGCGLFLFGLLALPVAAGMAAVAGWWTS